MHPTMRVVALPFAVAAALILPSQAHAAAGTFYVATNGSDSAAGTSSAPWRTLQHAADVATAGATVIVRAGSYRGVTINHSGTSSAPIVFQNDRGTRPIIDGGRSMGYVVYLNGVHDVKLTGFEITGANAFLGAGIEVDWSSGGVVLGYNIIRNNRDIGIHLYQSTNVRVTNNEIKYNSIGIEVKYSGGGDLIENNTIHDQNAMVVNDSAGGNDSGAVGVNFLKTTGAITARGNTLYNNRATSHDYGYDGGAWEIYGASNVTITGNRSWNNEDVLETGTDSGVQCSNNVFTRNVAWAGSNAPMGNAVGLTLRCAQNMLVANNTFTDLDYWIFDIHLTSGFAASINNLRIVNNVLTQQDSKIYAIGSGVPSSVLIDYNLVYSYRGYGIASVAGKGNTSTLTQLRQWTGYDVHGVQADPQYYNRTNHDYHVGSGSPAINRGTVLAGITNGFLGTAPDIGAYEMR
jgi:parallel beta-helix repeat protein